MLLTQQAIKNMGFEKFVSQYKLIAKEHPSEKGVYCLVYDQLNTPKNNTTNECRSLIIDTNTNTVVSYPLKRFFDGDKKTKINFKTAIFVEKEDGSLMHTYDYNSNWYVSSKSNADANGGIRGSDRTLNEYFFETLNKTNFDFSKNIGKTLIWEFKYPETGLVVCKEPSVTLIGERCLKTLKETVVVNNGRQFTSHEELAKYLEDLDPIKSEGLICITDAFDEFGNIIRYKYKSPQFEIITNLRPYTANTPEKQIENNRLNLKWLKTIRSINTHKSFLDLPKYQPLVEMYESVCQRYDKAYSELESVLDSLKTCKTPYDVLAICTSKSLQKFGMQIFKGANITIKDYLKNIDNF
jgi:hypothetical protein